MNRAVTVIINRHSAGCLPANHNRMDGKYIRCDRCHSGCAFRRHRLTFRGFIRLAVQMPGTDCVPRFKLRKSDLNRDLLLRLDLMCSVVKPEVEIIGGNIFCGQFRIVRRRPERIQDLIRFNCLHGNVDSFRKCSFRRIDMNGSSVIRRCFQCHRRMAAFGRSAAAACLGRGLIRH